MLCYRPELWTLVQALSSHTIFETDEQLLSASDGAVFKVACAKLSNAVAPSCPLHGEEDKLQPVV